MSSRAPSEPPLTGGGALDDPVELEHSIGYAGSFQGTVVPHPTEPNTIVHDIGSVVVIADITDPHKQEFLRGHDECVSTLIMSRSGALICSGQLGSTRSKDNEAPVIVWDYAQRRPVYQLFGLFQRVHSASFAPDDRFLLACDGDRTLIWDMQTGQTIGSMKFSCRFSLWGEMLEPEVRRTAHIPTYTFVTAHPNMIRCHKLVFSVKKMGYEMASDDCSLPSSGMLRDYTAGTLDHSLQYLHAGTTTGDLCVFDIRSQIFRASVPVSSGGLKAMAQHGEYVFIGSGDGSLKKLMGHDLNWGNVLETQLQGAVNSLEVCDGGASLLVGTSEGIIYKVATETLVATVLSASHVAAITCVAFGTRSDIFATGSKDGNVRVWDLSDYAVLTNIMGPGEVCCIAFTAEDLIITGWSDGFVRAHSASDGSPAWHIADAHRGQVTCLEVTAETLFSGGADGALRVWMLRNQTLLGQFNEHAKAVTGIVIDINDDGLVHTCSLDKSILTFDLRTERRANCHMLREGSFVHMCQRKDHEWELITSHGAGVLLHWDCDIADAVKEWEDPRRSHTTCLAISPSGKYMAAGCEDFTVKLWEVATDTVISVCLGHSSVVLGVKWSPDEKQFVSVSADCSICVWNFYG